MKKQKKKPSFNQLLDHWTAVSFGLATVAGADHAGCHKNGLHSPYTLSATLQGLEGRIGELLKENIDHSRQMVMEVLSEALPGIRESLEESKRKIRAGEDFNSGPYDPETMEWLWELDRAKAGQQFDAYQQLERLVDAAFRAGMLVRQVDLLEYVPIAKQKLDFQNKCVESGLLSGEARKENVKERNEKIVDSAKKLQDTNPPREIPGILSKIHGLSSTQIRNILRAENKKQK